MAITNYERVGKALELLRAGLVPFVERELKNVFKSESATRASAYLGDDRLLTKKPIANWDAAALLRLMWDSWNEVFRNVLGPAERSLISELRKHRNDWAHQQAFSSDDADRALDSMARLLTAVSAPEADEIQKMKMELRRLIFDEQMRSEKRKTAASTFESAASATLKPWREVVSPHADVARGIYQQAEFAADLWAVYIGQGLDEYTKPPEFFRRTFLTESLKGLLKGAVLRLSGKGGDPVVQLQTNFGGGKTHSMLALYHLFSGAKASELLGVDALLKDAGVLDLPRVVNRVVFVGNKVSPGNPVTKKDGTVVRTMWGEIAYQLGGKKAFERIRLDDERATSPGDRFRELLDDHGPCLILIDEWVAYARQLHDQADMPGGTFETHFTFAQALTESAKIATKCLLVISLPASDTGGSPHAHVDDVEVGGERGRAALDRLRNAVGRVESSWRPASAEEGFEIVRMRLFEPLVEQAQFVSRDGVARSFSELYRKESAEFPAEASKTEYERRLKSAYPIHPEVFDRLYGDWSTLIKFQRTRGVLRLMAAVIHSLWEKGDKNPLILPASIPIDDARICSELTRYLSDNWTPVIEKDVDGPSATPLRVDGEISTLGKYSACRRVARTIYLGSAPTASAATKGIEDRRIKLGCTLPGESPAVFGDVLRRLPGASTYLYQDGNRYWYSTQPTVTKLADDLAEQLKRDPDAVASEIGRRLRADLKKEGEFSRIHALPTSSDDVPDDLDARLVALSIDHPYSKDPGNLAEKFARTILETRGSAPRLYRNTLVFLAPDSTRLTDLDEAVRRFLAWDKILSGAEADELSKQQLKQADAQRESANATVSLRLPEVYPWMLVPTQASPNDPIALQAIRLSGSEGLAVRASKKLVRDELLAIAMAGTRLRLDLDRIPLWRNEGSHVEIRQLVEDFARYVYLQRVKEPSVVLRAIQDGVSLLGWDRESFGYADSFDESTARFRGLRGAMSVTMSAESAMGLLVHPDLARKQLDEDTAARTGLLADTASLRESQRPEVGQVSSAPLTSTVPTNTPPTRYHGSVSINASRLGADAGRISEEVVAHLVGLVGSRVRVSLEIEADVPGGAPAKVVRIVTENGRSLGFVPGSGFEHD